MKAKLLMGVILGASLVSFSAQGQAPSSSLDKNQIVIKTTGFEHARGKVMCALHREGDWLAKPVKSAVAKVGKDLRAECMFAQVKPGTYAIAVFHDENNNGELDSNFIGIPNEGVAISNMKKMGMGKPSFEDAKFVYSGGRFTTTSPMLY